MHNGAGRGREPVRHQGHAASCDRRRILDVPAERGHFQAPKRNVDRVKEKRKRKDARKARKKARKRR